jgi:hypothetical protein
MPPRCALASSGAVRILLVRWVPLPWTRAMHASQVTTLCMAHSRNCQQTAAQLPRLFDVAGCRWRSLSLPLRGGGGGARGGGGAGGGGGGGGGGGARGAAGGRANIPTALQRALGAPGPRPAQFPPDSLDVYHILDQCRRLKDGAAALNAHCCIADCRTSRVRFIQPRVLRAMCA